MTNKENYYYAAVSYDGSKFQGFATQPHHNTVQDELEAKLTMINSNKFVRIFAASRTDTGVHAFDQYIQFKLDNSYELEELRSRVNKLLPEEIIVKNIQLLPENFNVRYSVKDKTYEYLIGRDETPFFLKYLYVYTKELNVKMMKKAAEKIIGTHDFSAFTIAKNPLKNKIRTINYILIEESILNDIPIIKIVVNGDGFLYNMVRIIVGILLNIGSGKNSIEEIEILFLNKQRTRICETAPPQGLYLKKINY